MSKVYDCFLYSYNPDVLEIRLNVLNDVVDRFVIVESPYNWHGMFKGLTFAQPENLKRFEKFLHKIEYISVFDMPKYEHLPLDGEEDAALRLETFNRNAISRGLKDATDEDTVIISDFDEIPNPEIIQNIKNSNSKSLVALTMLNFSFKLNSLILGAGRWWTNSVVVPGSCVKNHSISDIRWGIRDAVVANKTSFANSEIDLVHYAGWHFTWIGDKKFINEKLDGYRHNQFRSKEGRESLVEELRLREESAYIQGAENITHNINVPIDSFFPQYLVNNQDRYGHLISKAVVEQSGNELKDKIIIDDYFSNEKVTANDR